MQLTKHSSIHIIAYQNRLQNRFYTATSVRQKWEVRASLSRNREKMHCTFQIFEQTHRFTPESSKKSTLWTDFNIKFHLGATDSLLNLVQSPLVADFNFRSALELSQSRSVVIMADDRGSPTPAIIPDLTRHDRYHLHPVLTKGTAMGGLLLGRLSRSLGRQAV